jgi:hypothetical protein
MGIKVASFRTGNDYFMIAEELIFQRPVSTMFMYIVFAMYSLDPAGHCAMMLFGHYPRMISSWTGNQQCSARPSRYTGNPFFSSFSRPDTGFIYNIFLFSFFDQ